MDVSRIYIIIFMAVLAAIFILFTPSDQIASTLTPLAGLAFGFVLAGILFGENRAVGYSFIGIGIVLLIIDLYSKYQLKR